MLKLLALASVALIAVSLFNPPSAPVHACLVDQNGKCLLDKKKHPPKVEVPTDDKDKEKGKG